VKARASASVLGLLLVWAGMARADAPSTSFQDAARPHRLWIQATGYTGHLDSDRVTTIAPRFGGAFVLGESIELKVQLPLVTGNFERKMEQTSETRTLPGNPFVGLGHVLAPEGFRLTVGGGAAVPLAQDKKSDQYDNLAFSYARASRAGREGWLYTPHRLPIVAYANLEKKIERGPLVGADFAFALMPRIRGSSDALATTAQLGVWAAAALVDDSLRLGGRIDSVLLASDRVQMAFVPFLHVDTDGGALFRAELTVNLNDPYGFAFEEGGVWGLSVYAGSRF